jgi:ABC-2 type transport system ATP-binding protein
MQQRRHGAMGRTTMSTGMNNGASIASLRDVTKAFGETTVIDHLSMTIEGGQVFGLIGPSGCGKTTLIRLMIGILAPTSGEARTLGTEPRDLSAAQRRRIGYTSQGFALYPTLTVAENARFVAGLYGLGFWRSRRRIRQVLEFLEIWEARRRLGRDLSGGMQRRLSLACALIHQPSLLFVDEPTSGLDPVLREKIWEYLRRLRDQGTTIVVTTQHIDEARYCDTVAILSDGQVLAQGSPAALRQRAMGGDLVDLQVETIGRSDLVALRAVPGVRSLRWTDQGTLRLVVEEAPTATPAILRTLDEQGVVVQAVQPYEPGFDEVFMTIIGAGRAADRAAATVGSEGR